MGKTYHRLHTPGLIEDFFLLVGREGNISKLLRKHDIGENHTALNSKELHK